MQSFDMVFFFRIFCWTMGVLLEYRNPKTNILPFSLLESCKYDEFHSLFNVAKKHRCDTKNERVALIFDVLHSLKLEIKLAKCHMVIILT